MSDAMDMSAYNELKNIMGEILDDLIQTFLDTVPEQIGLLQAAIEAEDCDQVFAVAHRIKSSSSSIGAAGLANSAEQIELKGRGGDISGTDELFPQLSARYDEVASFLRSELG